MALSYYWSRDEQRKYAEEKLFRYIRDYVFPFHPYYRKVMKEKGIDPERIYTYEDFRKIPITEKADTLADQRAFVLQPKMEGVDYEVEPLPRGKQLAYASKTFFTRYLRDVYGKPRSFKDKVRQTAMYEWLPIHYNFSGGTTGMPSAALYTRRDLDLNVRKVHGMIYTFGWEPDVRTISLFPGVPHVAFFAPVTVQFLVDNGGVCLHTFGGKAIPTERQVIIASMLGFNMICAIPSYFLYWLKTALDLKEKGWIEGIKGIKFAVVAAEPLTDQYRQRFKEYLEELGSPGVKIIEIYGMTETKAGFFECGEKTGAHLNPEFYFWEMLDPETREPVKWGEPGVLVFSHIDWRGTVLLRYWTGDLIQGGMVWEKCPTCGLTVPRIMTPIVRAAKDFTKIKGSTVPLLNFRTALHRVEGLDAFQVVIGKEDERDPLSRDKVTIYACLEEGADEEKVRRGIIDTVKMETEISPDEIVFEDPSSVERRLFERTGLKGDWVVDVREVTITQQAAPPPEVEEEEVAGEPSEEAEEGEEGR